MKPIEVQTDEITLYVHIKDDGDPWYEFPWAWCISKGSLPPKYWTLDSLKDGYAMFRWSALWAAKRAARREARKILFGRAGVETWEYIATKEDA